jgi:hypothetical protein
MLHNDQTPIQNQAPCQLTISGLMRSSSVLILTSFALLEVAAGKTFLTLGKARQLAHQSSRPMDSVNLDAQM